MGDRNTGCQVRRLRSTHVGKVENKTVIERTGEVAVDALVCQLQPETNIVAAYVTNPKSDCELSKCLQ